MTQMDADMKIKALAPWFGGKRNLAPEIVRELGLHSCYFEPFCGSMAVLLTKPVCAMETVNDLHQDIINLAEVVQNPKLGPRLYRELRRMIQHESVFEEADVNIRFWEKQGHEIIRPDYRRALEYFIVSWMGRNGTAGTPANHKGTYCLRLTKNGGSPGTRWSSVVDSIPGWRRRMKNVLVICRDGFDLLERIEDTAGVAIYVDPPYLVKGAKYLHDFKTEDHRRLAGLLQRYRMARVVVSYYDHPDLQALYPGWTKRTFDVAKATSHQNKRGSVRTRATEVLLMNGYSLVENKLF
jgi:DNA adenine methylase